MIFHIEILSATLTNPPGKVFNIKKQLIIKNLLLLFVSATTVTEQEYSLKQEKFGPVILALCHCTGQNVIVIRGFVPLSKLQVDNTSLCPSEYA